MQGALDAERSIYGRMFSDRPARPPVRIAGLDGLRAIAIALVLVGHSSHVDGADAAKLVSEGWDPAGLGVAIFFCLSGYLITALLLRERRIDLGAFYKRRALRILPAAFVFLAFAALFVPGRDIAWCVAFARNYEPDGSAFTGHFWSLAVEEQFYLAWPALLAFAPRRWLLPMLCGWLFVWPAWAHLHVGGNTQRTDLQSCAIVAGCALAIAAPHIGRPSIVLGAGALAIALGVLVPRLPLEGLWRPWLTDAGLVGVVAGAAAGGASWLDAAPMRWVGRLSYSLYLWQQPWLTPWGWTHGVPVLATWPLCLAPTLGLAVASHYLIERPMLHLRDRLRASPAGGPVPSP